MYKKLCALALAGSLDEEERLRLKLHLENCAPCRAIYSQYAEIGDIGMAFLACLDPPKNTDRQ
jgi:predicted anti-sigma-YlaC factor YlaD